MARRLFNLLTFLSFLAFVCLLALWIRQSHRFVPKQRLPQERGYNAMDRAVHAQLDRVLPVITFDDVSLSDALDFMRDVSGADLVVNWKSIDAAGIPRSKPITLRISGMTYATALARVVDAAGLAYAQDESLICISTRSDLRRIGTQYRPRWPWPSDEDLQVQQGSYADFYYAFGTQAPPQPLGVACNAAGRGFEVQPDVNWEALRSLGLAPQTPVEVQAPGEMRDWFEAVLRHASADHEIQYQVRNGRLLVAPKEWFDRDERPAD